MPVGEGIKTLCTSQRAGRTLSLLILASLVTAQGLRIRPGFTQVTGSADEGKGFVIVD